SQKARNDVEQGGLAAAGRAHNAEELRSFDGKAHPLDPGHSAGGSVIDERNAGKLDMRHDLCRSLINVMRFPGQRAAGPVSPRVISVYIEVHVFVIPGPERSEGARNP